MDDLPSPLNPQPLPFEMPCDHFFSRILNLGLGQRQPRHSHLPRPPRRPIPARNGEAAACPDPAALPSAGDHVPAASAECLPW